MLATKGVSSMLSSTLWRAFTTPVTYALIFILLGTAIMQIRYVNKALQRFDSTQVIPIQFVLFTLSVILGSAILYRDFEKTTAEQAGKFVGGCLLTFFGVFLITSGRQQKEDDDEDLLSEADGVEETIGLAQQDGNLSASGYEPSTPISKSRRSSRISRVSFADTIKPQTPQDDVQSLRYLSESPQSSLPRESAPLLGNVGESTWDISTSPPRGIRTYSEDSMPAPSPMAAVPPAHSHPATPLRDSQGAPIYPTDQLRPLGPARTMSHHRSKTFISPSPLSSTVTTVVKDAFLRANDNRAAQQSSLRRIRSSIRASLFFNDDESNEQAVSSDDNLVRSLTGGEQPAREAEPEDPARRRTRSVSDTLGDFFKPKRKKRKDLLSSDVESGIGGDSNGSGSDSNGTEHYGS